MKRIQLPLNQVIAGNCVEVLYSLPENSVDMVFADPPYNLQLQQELWRPNMTKVDAVDDEWDKFSSFKEYDDFTREWLVASRRVLKDSGTIWVIGSYHNIYRVGTIMQDLGYWILNDIVWVKTNPMPNFRGTRFTNAHETLLWAQKQRNEQHLFNHHTMKELNDDLQMRSDWELPICSKAERIKVRGEKLHSTQKPEALLYRVILSSTNPKDIILDPFFGTGTTGAVARKLDRYWIGIERDEKYIKAAQERISTIKNPTTNETVFITKARNQGFKIPFGKLLELGLVRPGAKIRLKNNKGTAIVLASGHILAGKHKGSIHAVASELIGARCNGWEHWQYFDKGTKSYKKIDELRKKAEAMIGGKNGKGRQSKEIVRVSSLKSRKRRGNNS